jgi:hypothetical protein
LEFEDWGMVGNACAFFSEIRAFMTDGMLQRKAASSRRLPTITPSRKLKRQEQLSRHSIHTNVMRDESGALTRAAGNNGHQPRGRGYDDGFEIRRQHRNLSEINLRAPSGASFRALQSGEMFLFKLHAPRLFRWRGHTLATRMLVRIHTKVL